MKGTLLLSLALVTAVAGCSGGAAPAPSTGGNGGAGATGGSAGARMGSGGSTASGGATASGGSLASGGSSAGASGSGGLAGQSSGGGQAGAFTGGATGVGGAGSGGQAGTVRTGDAGAGSGGGQGGATRADDAGAGSGGAASSGSGGTKDAGATAGAGGSAVSGASGGGTTVTGGISSGGISGRGGASGATSGGATGSGGTTGSGGATGSGGSTGAQHWVGSWTASPYYDSGNQPPVSLSSSVLRQIAHVSLGGSRIRVQFSNLGGNGSVTINSAHIALCKASPVVDSTIDTATDKALAFSGTASVTIAQGKEVWSDAIDFTVPNQGNITVTTAFGSVPSQVIGHSGSRTTSYIQSGSNVSAASMTSATTTEHWYYLSGIDVMADASAKGVVAIGDSITDGRGTDTNKNNRWTDIMAARLQANAATANVATMNQGIGATNLIGTSGTAAQARFKRDVLGQSAVRYVIVFDGVNDIGGGASYSSMKTAYDDLISQAHANGLLIYGATITPFNGNSYYTTAHESVRQQVNTYIKSGAFDGYIDFDAAIRDPSDTSKMQASYAQWSQEDWLHPGPAGYQAMGQAVDLSLFTK